MTFDKARGATSLTNQPVHDTGHNDPELASGSDTRAKWRDDAGQPERQARWLAKHDLKTKKLVLPAVWCEWLKRHAAEHETSESFLVLTLLRGLQGGEIAAEALPWDVPRDAGLREAGPTGRPLGSFRRWGARPIPSWNRKDEQAHRERHSSEHLGPVGSEDAAVYRHHLRIDPVIGGQIHALSERWGVSTDAMLQMLVDLLRGVDPVEGHNAIVLVGSAVTQARYVAKARSTYARRISAREWLCERITDAYKRERKREADARGIEIEELEEVPIDDD